MTDTNPTISPDDAVVEAVADAFERYDLIDGDDSSDGFKAKWFIIDNDIDDDGRDLDLHEKAVHSEYRKGADEDALREVVRLMNAQNAIRAYIGALEQTGWKLIPLADIIDMSEAWVIMAKATPKAPGAGGAE